MPWVKGFGTWPVGEEWLFQAWAESWYPVTDLLLGLAADGHRDVLTLTVTPPVAAQVADRRLRRDLGAWLAGQRWRAEEQRQYGRTHDSRLAALAPVHWRHFDRLLAIHERIEALGGLLAAWSELADDGIIQVLGSAGTHAYLPLLEDPRSIDHQLWAGVESHAGWRSRRPRGLWPPELGYRPRGPVADPTRVPRLVGRHGTPVLARGEDPRPGLEEHYAAWGIDHFVVDGPTLLTATGVDGDWTTRPEPAPPGGPHDVCHDGVLVGESDVVAFGRDLAVAYRVWSPDGGYPGHPAYRDFHARGDWALHPSWRVTDRSLDVRDKELWDPEATPPVVAEHVVDFHGLLHRVLDDRPGGLVAAAFDTELYGHWWHEGPHWLDGVLRRVAADPTLRLTTLASRRDRHPPTRRLALPESSWGWAKGHAAWIAPKTRWMWERIRTAEPTVHAALDRLADGPDGARPNPEARAAILAEFGQLTASDWPFMVTRGTAGGYAADRVGRHDQRLTDLLADLTTGGEPEADEPPAMPWPDVDTHDDTTPDIASPQASNSNESEGRAASTPAPQSLELRAQRAHSNASEGRAASTLQCARRALRILEVSWEYPPRIVGGLGRHVEALAGSLACLGHEVTVVTRGHPDAPARERVDGVDVHRVADPVGLDRRDHLVEWILDLNTRLAATATRFARDHAVDVVHVHDWVVAAAGIGVREALEVPLVATFHATEQGRHQGFLPGAMNRWIHQVEWWLAATADRLVVCSTSMRDHVTSSFGVDRDRVDLVPNGIDLDGFGSDVDPLQRGATRQRWAPDGQHLVVFVGRLEFEKGVQTMLSALPNLRDRHGPVRFVVAGVGSQRDELQARAESLGVAGHVAFPGFVPAEDLPALYAAADVVVVPSLYEPFGLVVLEALACGSPVVASDTGGLGELARSGAGIAVPPADVEAWVDAVGALLDDPAAARRVVRRGRQVARDGHDWGAVAAATTDTFRTACADPDWSGHDHDLRRDLWSSPFLDLPTHT